AMQQSVSAIWRSTDPAPRIDQATAELDCALQPEEIPPGRRAIIVGNLQIAPRSFDIMSDLRRLWTRAGMLSRSIAHPRIPSMSTSRWRGPRNIWLCLYCGGSTTSCGCLSRQTNSPTAGEEQQSRYSGSRHGTSAASEFSFTIAESMPALGCFAYLFDSPAMNFRNFQ